MLLELGAGLLYVVSSVGAVEGGAVKGDAVKGGPVESGAVGGGPVERSSMSLFSGA